MTYPKRRGAGGDEPGSGAGVPGEGPGGIKQGFAKILNLYYNQYYRNEFRRNVFR